MVMMKQLFFFLTQQCLVGVFLRLCSCKKKGNIICKTLILLFCIVSVVQAEDGIKEKEIILGQSCALSGPARALGTGMRAGLNAYFAKINAAGGVKGRAIRLISLDDGYEPYRAIINTRRLIENDRVFLLIGEVGTPTSKAVIPMAEKAGIPFFGPFSGAEFLRNPFKKYVINVRGSYYQEMEKLVQYVVDHLGKTIISCFYQNDGYGQAGLTGIQMALAQRSLKLVSSGTYERNTIAVKSGLLKIKKSNPEAVIMVGAYKPCAEFIKLGKKIGMKDVLFCNISFVGTEALRKELGEAGEGSIVSQVVKFPWDTEVPLVKEYIDTMQKYLPGEKIGFVSLEGFMVGKLFSQAAASVTGELTREKLISTIESVSTFDLGGVNLKFGPDDHQGMDDVFLTVIKGGKMVPL